MTDVQTRSEATCRHDRADAGASMPTRRAVFGGAGALGAACFLAAGGTNTGSSGNNEPGYTNEPGPAGSSSPGAGDSGGDNGGQSGQTLAAAGDVPIGGGIIAGDLVITQPESGQYRAFSKVCTHQGCDVSRVDGGVIICPCHNSEFSIRDGSPQSGPARQALPETKVTLDGDNIVAA